MKKERSIFFAPSALTKHPIGGVKELIILSFPLTLIFFSTSILAFCDRYFLSHFSLESWKSCSAITPLTSFFQVIFISIAGIAQTFVGRFKGKGESRLIGPHIWQMIWFSFFTMFLTYPLSKIVVSFIKGSEIEAQGIQYFQLVTLGNFLYPLSASLSSFFSGVGKMKTLLLSILIAHILNISLDIVLIFGIKGFIPPLGIAGAAIATLISQLTLCSTLFFIFIKKHNITTYCSHLWKVNWIYMWAMLKKGVPFSIGRAVGIACWLFASFIMINKGADHLLSLSFVTTLYLCFAFINEGLAQTLITVISHTIGKNKELFTFKIFLSAMIILSLHFILLFAPFCLFSSNLISFFITDNLGIASKNLLTYCCLLIWFQLLFSGFYKIALSFIIASKDILFFSFVTPIIWLTFYLPVLLGIKFLRLAPTLFFITECINYFAFGMIFLLRFKSRFWKKKSNNSYLLAKT